MDRAYSAELQRLGKNLKLARIERDMTQEEVAFALGEGDGSGADRGYISRLERGQLNPSASTVLRLARVLRTTPAALFEGVE